MFFRLTKKLNANQKILINLSTKNLLYLRCIAKNNLFKEKTKISLNSKDEIHKKKRIHFKHQEVIKKIHSAKPKLNTTKAVFFLK